MIKKISLIIFTIFITTYNALAHDFDCTKSLERKKHNKQVNEFLIEKLNLTQEQQNELKKYQSQHRKKMKSIIKEMQEEHDKIRNVYLSGIPKFQADIKTAPSKAHLVILKQNADKLRKENRKNFENLLTDEQKIEFEKLKKEHSPAHSHKIN